MNPEMILTTLLVSSLLNQALVEVVNHGEVLQGLRSAVYGWAESLRFPPLRLAATPLRALHCPYCFSHWTGLSAAVVTATAAGCWWWGLVLWLPATRLSNAFNDLLAGVCRTPGSGSMRLSDARPQDLEARLMELLPDHILVKDEEKAPD